MSEARLKVALAGTGRMAEIYADAIADRRDAELCAIVGHTPDKTRALADRHQVPGYAGGRYADLLRDQPEVDAYIVATPEWVRLEPLQALVATGKPILVEKPLAASASDAEKLRAFTAEERSRITVAHVLRFSPRFSQAQGVVAGGSIGDVRHLSSRRNPSLASVQRVLGRFELGYWLSCHDIDVMRWMVGDEVESVFAASRSRLTSADDYLMVHLRFAGGVDAFHEVSWCTPPLADQAPNCRMSIRGTKGIVEIDDSSTGVDVYQAEGRLSSPDTYEVYRIAGVHHGLFAMLIDRWIRSIRDGLPAYPSFGDAMAAVDVCTAIMRSIESGMPERVTR